MTLPESSFGRGFRAVSVLLVVAALVVLGVTGVAGRTGAQSTGDAKAEEPAQPRIHLSGVARFLGTNELAKRHVMYALWEESGTWRRGRLVTDDQGKYSLGVPAGATVRIFSTGEWLVPPSWSRVRLTEQGEGVPNTATHDLWLRSHKPIEVTGQVTLPNGGNVSGAQVVLAPLDLMPDGSLLPVSPPFQFNLGSSGTWKVDIPAGIYDAWALWSDRDTDDWSRYYAQARRVEVYQKRSIDLAMRQQGRIRGKVLDASSEDAPAEATVELFTHAYLRQLKMFTGDATDSGGELPPGVFEDQLSTIDSSDFTIVVCPAAGRDAVLVVPGMSMERFSKAPVLRLRDAANGKLTLTYRTKDRAIPLNLSIQVQPLGEVAAPMFVRHHLSLVAEAGEDGVMTFWGLPKGRYAMYAQEGGVVLGEIDVTGGIQSATVELDAPFATGKITYPDGTPCTNASVWVMVPQKEGRERVVSYRAFENIHLKNGGKYYAPLFFADGDCEIVFAAAAGNGEVGWGDTPDTLPFITDPIKLSPSGKGAIDLDVKLKPRQ